MHKQKVSNAVPLRTHRDVPVEERHTDGVKVMSKPVAPKTIQLESPTRKGVGGCQWGAFSVLVLGAFLWRYFSCFSLCFPQYKISATSTRQDTGVSPNYKQM